MNTSILKKPSAWLPLTMSLASLMVLLTHITIIGTNHEADEGTTAHLFQLLMAGQVPIIIFFIAKWLPRDAKQVFAVLAFQVGIALLPIAIVYFLKL